MIVLMLNRLAVSANGWIDSRIALAWIQHLDDQTRTQVKLGETRVLVVDGHDSHIANEVTGYAVTHGIEMLSYVPNATHIYQGLDVTCFGVLKTYWGEERRAYEERTGKGVTKDTFLDVYARARNRAFTTTNILAAFHATGLSPFNPNVIQQNQLNPSTSFSTHGTFPLAQPSPVARFLQTWNNTYKTSPQSARNPNFALVQTSPPSPTHEVVYNFGNDLSNSGMAYLLPSGPDISPHHGIPSSTSSANPIDLRYNPHLLQSPKQKWSKEKLIKQNLQLRQLALDQAEHIDATDEIMHEQNGQLIVQNLYCDRLHQALYGVKNAKRGGTSRRRLFATDVGRHLTGSEWQAAVTQMRAVDGYKDDLVEIRKAITELNKEKREWRHDEVADRKRKRETDIAEWKAQKLKAKESGHLLPSRPKVLAREPTPEEYLVREADLTYQREMRIAALKKNNSGEAMDVADDADDEDEGNTD